ncbi:MAG: hypothetical protein ACT4QD_11435 [Acidobacteriota bacterium]
MVARPWHSDELERDPRGATIMDVQQFLQRFARRQRLLVDRLGRAEELADALSCDLADLERALAPGSGPARQSGESTRRRRLVTTDEVCAAEIAVRRRHDDWGLIRVDQAEAFPLSPLLTDLLAILADDGGPSEDGLVAWKGLDEVAKQLQKKSGRRYRRHAVTQLVYRLRRELSARGHASPMLVQTSRRLGVRVALRRRSSVWTA